jgi:hypothetical protein
MLSHNITQPATEMNVSLGRFRLHLFGLAPSCETLLLRSVVRTRFQFVVLTLVAVEENDLLRVFGLRHGVVTSGIALTARAFWRRDAEAPASSDASASCYRLAENVLVLAVVKPKLKFVHPHCRALSLEGVAMATPQNRRLRSCSSVKTELRRRRILFVIAATPRYPQKGPRSANLSMGKAIVF